MKKMTVLAGMALLLAAPASLAQVVHQEWEAHGTRGDCYAVTFPLLSDGAENRPGQAYVSVTHKRSEGLRDAVSFVSGLEDVTDSEVSAMVTSSTGVENSFELLPFGGAAFARGGAPEKSLITAMKSGRELVVTWKTSGGATIQDRYSLMGFTAAHGDIGRRCPG